MPHSNPPGAARGARPLRSGQRGKSRKGARVANGVRPQSQCARRPVPPPFPPAVRHALRQRHAASDRPARARSRAALPPRRPETSRVRTARRRRACAARGAARRGALLWGAPRHPFAPGLGRRRLMGQTCGMGARGAPLAPPACRGAPLVILSGSRGSCGPWQRLVHASKGFVCDPQHRESVTMPREGGPRGCAPLKGWARSAKAPRPKKSWSRARGRCANLSRREGSADACFSSAPPPLPSPLQNKVVVAGDVGGTNARWQLYSGDTLLFDRRYPTASHTTLEKSLGAFLEEAATAGHDGRPEAACVAAAGPVAQDRCEMTNLGWTVRSARTCSCDLVSTP